MEFTGERFVPGLKGTIAYEHLHRYAFCSRFVAGARVLDAACGEGYGSVHLARTAAEVVGIDIHEETILEARRTYADHHNVRFDHGDVARLPYDDASFDVVVSLETLEHLAEPELFLREAARILKPSGRLIVSTPNKPVYAKRGPTENPFHLHEFERSEFETALGRSFARVRLLGQRFYAVSVLGRIDETEDGSPNEIVCRSEDGRLGDRPPPLDEPIYFLAICSKAEDDVPATGASFFLDGGDDLWAEQQHILRWASGVDQELRDIQRAANGIMAERDALERKLEGEHLAYERLAAVKVAEWTNPHAASEHALLTETVRGLRQERDDAKDHTLHLSAEIASLQTALRFTEAEAATEARARLDRERELAARIAERDALEAVLGDIEAERVGLRDEIARLSTERDTIAALLARGDREVERLGADLERVRGERDRAGADRERLRAERSVIQSERRALTANMDGAHRGIDGARAVIRRPWSAAPETPAPDLPRAVQALAADVERATRWQAHTEEAYRRRLSLLDTRIAVSAELETARAWIHHAIEPRDVFFPRRAAPPASGSWPRLSRRALRNFAGSLATYRLFDAGWYRQTHRDVTGQTDADALAHFMAEGLSRGLDPHPLFSGAWLQRHGTVPADVPPVVAYVTGRTTGDPHPVFHEAFYDAENPDVRLAGMLPLPHYLRHGAEEGRQPHPAFDPAWFDRQRDEHGPADTNPLVTYLETPGTFHRSPHPLFDGLRYLRQLPALAERGINPLLHYLVRGERQGLTPHPLFEPAYYLQYGPDMLSGESAFVHFLRHGLAGRRRTHPLFDAWFYAEANAHEPEARDAPLLHYVRRGAAEGRRPTRDFPIDTVAEALPYAGPAARNPVIALLEAGRLGLEVRPAPLADEPEREPAPAAATTRDPQDARRLRDYVESRSGSDAASRIDGLMGILERYGDRADAFATSFARDDLGLRLRRATRRPEATVDVSIVIPVHNALPYTMTCIAAILETPSRARLEILVGDDASTDATPDVFGSLGGRVRLVRHERNLGFLGNCNATAGEATGRHLLFLNNDTLPLPGWLDALVDLADRDPEIGFVGSKLLNADGTLQEAGGIFWDDGSAWNFGRNDDPAAPEYNYVKDVDYCSGASILVPGRVWAELAGFDRFFEPAYCEDADIAFRARAAGYRAVYQPFSEVIHHEGRSHGTDTTAGIKAYQVINLDKFQDRWGSELGRFHFPNAQNVELARDRSRDKPHILVVDHYVPQWDRDAGSRVMFHYLRAFIACGFQVTFWPDNLRLDPDYTRPLQELGVEVIYSTGRITNFGDWLKPRADIFDYVLLSRPHIAINYIDTIRSLSEAKIFYYGVDLHWVRLAIEYEVRQDPDCLVQMEFFRELETRICRMSDVVIFLSEEERAIVTELVEPTTAVVTTPGWLFEEDELVAPDRIAALAATREPCHLLFVGGFAHPPNKDGILWFVEHVLPLLILEDDRFRLSIAGSNPPPEILALASESVAVLGYVSDAALAALYDRVAASVVPLRFGGGVKGKVIEALAKGTPLVSTPVGFQGVPDPERFAFLAEDAASFAQAILRATADSAEATRKSQVGLLYLRETYSVDNFVRCLSGSMPRLSKIP